MTICKPKAILLLLGLAGSSGPYFAVRAQIIVSANDGKQVRSGDLVAGPFPDQVLTLTLDQAGRLHFLGQVDAPATLNGPPVSVAVARDSRFALVTCAQRFDPAGKLQPYGVVSMIDITVPAHPSVVASLELPPGAMGVTMTRNNKIALVASASDDSVAIIAVTPEKGLKLIDTIRLEAKSEPRDVIIAPDGHSAYIVRFGDGKITQLLIDGAAVRRGADIAVGINPDGAIISRDGKYLYNTNFGGTPSTGKTGAISTVDLQTQRMVAAIAVGQTPEHVALSADGRYLVSIVGNGSAFTRDAPNYLAVVGKLRIYRAGEADLVPVAEANIGHNCQGASFSDSGRYVVVQCAVEKTIDVFKFDGTTLTAVDGATLTFDTRPGAMATAKSR